MYSRQGFIIAGLILAVLVLIMLLVAAGVSPAEFAQAYVRHKTH